MVPVVLALMLQACATASVESNEPRSALAETPAASEPAPSPGEGVVPELKLNMPQQANCPCPTVQKPDYTFLEKGYAALLDGEYDDAMQHFERYQRLESSARADLEAGIAIAYVRMLPRSDFYDPAAARNAFREMREKNPKKLKVHEYTRLMRQSLLNLLELQGRIEELKAGNATLKEDLKKREEALKRLRDLTLNQKAAAQ
jgi:TolA-binding protein